MLLKLLRQLGFNPEVQDPWGRLGLSAYDGPPPEEYLIRARGRAALQFLALRNSSTWPSAEVIPARETAIKIQEAQDACLLVAQSIALQRRKVIPANIPLFRELGPWALQNMLSFGSPGEPLHLYTQLSSVIVHDQLPGAATADTRLAREYTRLLITKPEQLWDHTRGQHIVMWMPPHHGALDRALKTLFARRDDPGTRPLSLRLVDTYPVHAGMVSPKTIEDYYQSPALGYANRALLTNVTYTTTPLSVVLPSDRFPRQAYVGLAVFTYHLAALRSEPRIREPYTPEFSVAAENLLCLDFETKDYGQLLCCLRQFPDALFGQPILSPGSSDETPRLSLKVVPPSNMSPLVLFQRLRHGTGRLAFPPTICGGATFLFHDKAAVLLTLDAKHAAAFLPYCEQFLWLSAKQALLTARTPDEWTALFDQALLSDPGARPPGLRYRASCWLGEHYRFTWRVLRATLRRSAAASPSPGYESLPVGGLPVLSCGPPGWGRHPPTYETPQRLARAHNQGISIRSLPAGRGVHPPGIPGSFRACRPRLDSLCHRGSLQAGLEPFAGPPHQGRP